MTTVMVDAPETKTKRRGPVRASARPAAQKTKVTLVLEDDAAKRLAVYAAMTDRERSSVVSELIRTHLRRFVVQDRSRPSDPSLPVTEIGGEASA
jgi:hypothetical protein